MVDHAFTRRVFDEAASFGICYGYTIPIHHWHGRFAALTFATDRHRAAFLHTTQFHARALEVITYQVHRQAREKLEHCHFIAGIHLTCRERQCLKLSGQGKTFPDIAVILSISPRIAKNYIDGAKAKFGVRTAREACEPPASDTSAAPRQLTGGAGGIFMTSAHTPSLVVGDIHQRGRQVETILRFFVADSSAIRGAHSRGRI